MDTGTVGQIIAIIVAAGRGTRMGTELPKQLLPYGASTVLGTVLDRFARRSDIDSIILVSPADGSLDGVYAEICGDVLRKAGADDIIRIVRGGETRGDSVTAGLRGAAETVLGAGSDPRKAIVLIHDAARPGVTDEIISGCIGAVRECGAATAAVPSVDSIRVIMPENSSDKSSFSLKESMTYPIMNSNVVERSRVYRVQTPQAFILADIIEAYERAAEDGFTGTDDASVAEHAGIAVSLVPGSESNNKITYQEDIGMTTRVGTGYDVHRLVPGRDLILCGTPVPCEKGLLGHSDADVAAHALMDALLGAAGLGDIGRHFPDSDDRYKGTDSMELLAEVRKMLGDAAINNVDITIIAQGPRLSPYNRQMTDNIARVLGIPASAVNVKATTEEGLGFTGRGEGIAAIASCAIEGRFI